MGKKYYYLIFILCLFIICICRPSFAQSNSAYLDITSTPNEVVVLINGNKVGTTPVTGLDVPAGEVSISASKIGYGSATYNIHVKPNELKKVRIVLKPTKEQTGETQQTVTISQDTGNLLVINTLGDVEVYIDNQPKGKGSIKIVNMAAGFHMITVGGLKRKIKIYKDYLTKIKVIKNDIILVQDKEIEAANRLRIKKLKEEEQRKLADEKAALLNRKQNTGVDITIILPHTYRRNSRASEYTHFKCSISFNDGKGGKKNYETQRKSINNYGINSLSFFVNTDPISCAYATAYLIFCPEPGSTRVNCFISLETKKFKLPDITLGRRVNIVFNLGDEQAWDGGRDFFYRFFKEN